MKPLKLGSKACLQDEGVRVSVHKCSQTSILGSQLKKLTLGTFLRITEMLYFIARKSGGEIIEEGLENILGQVQVRKNNIENSRKM